MSALSKLSASWFHLAQENTVALANAHFDFSLIKIESPVEFRAVGAALADRRRLVAEDGQLHIVARKLGALLDGVLPQRPALLSAYGKRASEITAEPNVNPLGSSSDGVFRDHVGADGSGIWAAATSGQSSISGFLLACLLARVWTAAEAISIWTELVDARKKELETIYDQDQSAMIALSASRIVLTKDQLAMWDASARSWLEIADKAMGKRHVQLMLIVNNVDLPVAPKLNVYDGVLAAFTAAANNVEKIILGESLSVQEGSILLGLAAWHFYPDLLVLGKCPTPVVQHDPLINGGQLTIGLKMSSTQRKRGVFWSLPLAHLRHYGDPVSSIRSTADDGTKISFELMVYVVLGCTLRTWAKYSIKLDDGIEVIHKLWSHLLEGFGNRWEIDGRSGRWHWLPALGRAAKQYMEAGKTQKEVYSKLIRFGSRQGKLLGPSGIHATPLFGLSSSQTLFSLLTRDEAQIALLRHIASGIEALPDELLIKYKASVGPGHWKWYEYATALPITVKTESSQPRQFRHLRWMLGAAEDQTSCYCSGNCLNDCRCLALNGACTERCACRKHCAIRNRSSQRQRYSQDLSERAREVMTQQHEYILDIGGQDDEITDDLIFTWPGYLRGEDLTSLLEEKAMALEHPFVGEGSSFKIIAGNPDSAALYMRQPASVRPKGMNNHSRIYGVDVLKYALEKKFLSAHALGDHIMSLSSSTRIQAKRKTSSSFFYDCLMAAGLAVSVYDRLPQSSVLLGAAMLGPLAEASWFTSWKARCVLAGQICALNKDEALACVVMFDTGRLNLEPSLFKKVMAVSSANSLYVSARLLSDPSSQTDDSDIRQLIGNVGRAGLLLLVPPIDPKIRSQKLNTWNQINHDPHNGKVEDLFQETSLHLSFTGAEQALDLGAYGERTAEAYYIESLVSVHDRGEWVADLDILGMFEKDSFRSVNSKASSVNSKHECTGEHANIDLATITGWDELLDLPQENPSVVMCSGNWLARLAISAVVIQQGNEAHLLAPLQAKDACWDCVKRILRRRQDMLQPVTYRSSKEANDGLDNAEKTDNSPGGEFEWDPQKEVWSQTQEHRLHSNTGRKKRRSTTGGKGRKGLSAVNADMTDSTEGYNEDEDEDHDDVEMGSPNSIKNLDSADSGFSTDDEEVPEQHKLRRQSSMSAPESERPPKRARLSPSDVNSDRSLSQQPEHQGRKLVLLL
ncbi:hypothetical protein LTR84_002966 [Exophiala bonariae]|uniref:Tesmin/TSO1-like CXC domain-containing protein n=1 Tax=Exophiala bonariae TaxID=1690606 RepID=A0AAV9NCZ9_9EURO|nr:hypothetical protein LTR84_002966 [Exophiala bonariae]